MSVPPLKTMKLRLKDGQDIMWSHRLRWMLGRLAFQGAHLSSMYPDDAISAHTELSGKVFGAAYCAEKQP